MTTTDGEAAGFPCVYCKGRALVTSGRIATDGTRVRRRKCASCGESFSTLEMFASKRGRALVAMPRGWAPMLKARAEEPSKA